MNRGLALIGSLLVGYVVGGIAIMIPIMLAALIFPLPKWVWQFPFSMIDGLVGVGVMLAKAQAQSNAPPLTSHGSARFSRRVEDQATLGGEGLIVGRSDQGWLMRYGGPAHLLTIAPTRSGKGVGAIIPNLLTAERSVLCIDPKGENARITSRARGRMGPVFVLDPFEISGQPTAAFNPLAALEPESPDLAEDAAMIADALVYDPPHQVGEAHCRTLGRSALRSCVAPLSSAALDRKYDRSS